MGRMKNKMKYYSGRFARVLLLLAPAFLISIQHLTADPPANGDIGEAEKTDLGTGAIEPPDNVQNNPDLIYVLELLLRAPVTQLKDGEPPYDQEPPDAQQDFRRVTEPPVPTEPPVIPTEPPVVPTEPPVIPTEPPSIPTEPPPIEPPPRPRPPKRPPVDRPPPDIPQDDVPNVPPNDIN